MGGPANSISVTHHPEILDLELISLKDLLRDSAQAILDPFSDLFFRLPHLTFYDLAFFLGKIRSNLRSFSKEET